MMSPVKVAEIAAERSIHPVWRDLGGNFFRQGFLQGYYWGRSELTSRMPLVFAVGFLLGYLASYL
jgi:hypothetical protein